MGLSLHKIIIVAAAIVFACLTAINSKQAAAQTATATATTTATTTVPMGQRQVSLFISNHLPKAGEIVEIKAITHKGVDPSKSEFAWFLNDRPLVKLSGVGKNKISLAAGAPGERKSVKLRVLQNKTIVGTAFLDFFVAAAPEIQATAEASPSSEITLLWSAVDSYVPRWYKGKALPGPDTVIQVAAIPRLIVNGAVADPESLTYQWSLDHEVFSWLSGAGKNTFRFSVPETSGTTHFVRVRVLDDYSGAEKETAIIIKSAAPKFLIYKVSPLGGTEFTQSAPKVVPTFGLGTVDIIAEPFFIKENLKREGRVRWRAGSKSLDGSPANPFILSVDTRGLGRELFIDVSIADSSNVLRQIKKFIRLAP